MTNVERLDAAGEGDVDEGGGGGGEPTVRCVDQSADCPMWAAAGECERNRQPMSVACAKSCGLCTAADAAAAAVGAADADLAAAADGAARGLQL